MPRKNIRPLGGKPLLVWTVEAALAAERLDRVILSTEDEEIADVGRRAGVEVPFLRPVELAGDDTPSLLVVQHALGWMEGGGERFDAVCLLQPTSPFRRPEWIDGCIDLLESRDVDAVVTVARIPAEYHPYWAYLQDGKGFLRLSNGAVEPVTRRQDLPPAYYREGSVYVTKAEIVRGSGSLYGERLAGYEVRAEESVNIDSPEDWMRAEAMCRARLGQG